MHPTPHTRRHFLAQSGFGLSSLALTYLLNQDAIAAPAKPTLERPTFDLLPKQPHSEPQAMAMISLFMQGGPSHIDMFEPKPELDKRVLDSVRTALKPDPATNLAPEERLLQITYEYF